MKDVAILSTRQGHEWWLMFRGRFEPVGRVVSIEGTATPQGDHAWVRCGDPADGSGSREDAEQLRALMVEQGVPSTAVSVRREPAGLPGWP